MKIGELFVVLGFKLEGRARLEELEKGMTAAAVLAGKAALGVGSLTTALGFMLNMSMDAGVELKKFAAATGLSTDELQRWQFMAEQNNVSGKEMLDTIKEIQKAGADIRLGRGNIAPWQLFGVDPTQDPFTVLKNLRAAINRFPEDIARTIAGDAGISDDVFQMLRNTNLEFDKLEQKYIASRKQAEDLARLKGQWAGIKFELTSIGIQLTATFLPLLQKAVPYIQKGADKLADFVKFLQSGTPEAERWKMILEAAVVAIVAMAVGLGALVALFVTLATVFAVLELGPLLADLALVTGAIAGIVYLVNDLIKAAKGMQSDFDWKLAIAGGNVMAGVIQGIIGLVDLLRLNWSGAVDDFKSGLQDLKDASPFSAAGLERAAMKGVLGLMTHGGGGTNNTHNDHKTNISIDGAQSPQDTAKAVAEMLNRTYAHTSGQTGIYSGGY